MAERIRFPDEATFTLANIRLHRSVSETAEFNHDAEGLALADMRVVDGRIATIKPAGTAHEDAIDAQGGIVFPCFVDCHTHLDKGHIWPRCPNPNGSFMGALDSLVGERRANWKSEDVERRMDFALRAAYAHGTKAIRTHIDSMNPQETISWPVFQDMRARWKDRITLQAVCLFGIEDARDEGWFNRLADIVAEAGGVMGAVTYMVPDLDTLLDRIFRKAIDLDLDLDFHADETDDIASVSLARIAEAALRHDFQGRVLVGHCCSLARQPDKVVFETLDRVAKAGISVVSLPMCNMYLQDRRMNATTPRWRGVTLLHEMRARGITVAIASDNTRDPFYAYGDLDMLEVYRDATRILQFNHPVADWPDTVAASPAKIMRLADAGWLKPGAGADFVLFRGRNFTEWLSRPETDRIVIRNGRRIDTTLPDYSELDDLLKA